MFVIFLGTVIYNKCMVLVKGTWESRRVWLFSQACLTLPDWTWTPLPHKGWCGGKVCGWCDNWSTTPFPHFPCITPSFSLGTTTSFAFVFLFLEFRFVQKNFDAVQVVQGANACNRRIFECSLPLKQEA